MMPKRLGRSDLVRRFPELKHIPRERDRWDHTLAALAYGLRMDMPRAEACLDQWAIMHGLPASQRLADAEQPLVLWHGTSRQRAEKITEHGVFHKRGLWTAVHPAVPHAFCRMRAERHDAEGAALCLVIDQQEMVEGYDYEIEPNGNVYRFCHALPAEVVQYVLLHDELRFTGARARQPRPWPTLRLKRVAGRWQPISKPPVRYDDQQEYHTLDEFLRISVTRLLTELDGASPMEILSALYSLVTPAEAVNRDEVFALLEQVSSRVVNAGKAKRFAASQPVLG